MSLKTVSKEQIREASMYITGEKSIVPLVTQAGILGAGAIATEVRERIGSRETLVMSQNLRGFNNLSSQLRIQGWTESPVE